MQILIIFIAYIVSIFYGFNFYLNQLKNDYDKDGFVVVPDLLSENEVQSLLDETIQIARGKRGIIEGLTIADDNESDIDVLSKYLTFHFPHKASSLIKPGCKKPDIPHRYIEKIIDRFHGIRYSKGALRTSKIRLNMQKLHSNL